MDSYNCQESDDLKIVTKAIQDLSEHFDSIQIFATRYDANSEGATVNVSKGTGNWFARAGQVREWIIKEDEASRKSVRDEQ